MECLANKKLCLQNGTTEFEDDLLGHVSIDDCTTELLIPRVIKAYSEQEQHLDFGPKVVKLVEKLVNNTITLHNGAYNPLNRHIVFPELPFDIEITKPWAWYSYDFKGEKLEGFLRIKGTMDLITELSPGVYEMLDWKTGGRLQDWNTGKPKNFDTLQYDDQLLLYYYALRTLYPNLKQVIVTIFFVKHQPFTMCFDDRHYIRAEKMLRTTFEEIKQTTIPTLNVSFKCKWCPLFAQYKNTSKSICQHLHEEVLRKGIQKTTEEYAQKSFLDYGSGGGRGHKSV